MSYDYEKNLYYYPERSGLKIIGELNDPHACYSFDDLVVWQSIVDGKLYYASDSGCSCPSPFDGFDCIEDLTEITNETWVEFDDAVDDHCVNDWSEQSDSLACDKVEMLAKVALLLAA